MRVSFPAITRSVLKSCLGLVRYGTLRLLKYLATRQGRQALCGSLSGIYLFTFCYRLLAGLGTSPTMLAGTGLALAMGCQIALWQNSRRRNLGSSDPLAWGTSHFALASWLVAFDGLIEGALRVAGMISAESLAQAENGIAFAMGTTVALIAVPAYVVTRLPAQFPAKEKNETSQQSVDGSSYLVGLASGIIIHAMFIAPNLGVQGGGLIAATISAALFLVSLALKRQTNHSITKESNSSTPTMKRSSRVASLFQLGWGRMLWNAWLFTVIALLGAILTVSSRLLHQLMPVAGYLIAFEWATLAVGVALGLRLVQIQRKKNVEHWLLSSPGYACLAIAATTIGLLIGYRELIGLMLAFNSNIPYAWFMMVMRCCVVAMLFVPIGIGWSIVADNFRSQSFRHRSRNAKNDGQTKNDHRRTWSAFQPLAFVAGTIVMHTVGFPNAELPLLLIATSWLLALLGVACWLETRQLPKSIIARSGLASLVCLIAVGAFFRNSGQGELSAKLLFATNVFGASKSGTDAHLLPFLDDGRCIAKTTGDHGTYTLWKYRGSQLHIREGGIPKAIITTHPDICPAYSGETMHAVLPLVLHESPRNVLLLGMGSGAGLSTCLPFPIPQITCVENDGGLLKMLQNVVWPRCEFNVSQQRMLDNNRVTFLKLDPVLAVTDRRQSYDIIISRPDQSALWQSAPYSTLEFYRRSSRLLSPNGIFCQRFQQIDYGPEPLRILARTMKAAFTRVIAVQTGPGDLVLLATNSQEGIVRDGFKERLQRRHVRSALANLGWDWTVPLTLLVLPHDGLTTYANNGSSRRNTAANGLFTFRLPQEMMRWGTKWQKQQQSMSKHATRFLAWPGFDGNDPEILRRLSEITERQKLMVGFPDQKWAYRKTLREQMMKQRESIAEQFESRFNDSELHPQDKLRKHYFEALGKAVSNANRNEEDIQRIAEFTEPYDPLMSYFAHHEVAELLKKTKPHNAQAEWHHRLHLAYYSHSRDRSVRNVSAALELIVRHPECVPDPVERFDHINGLLQIIKTRWQVRGTPKPKSVQFVLNDVEKTVSAIERAFDVMDKLAGETNLAGMEWTSRREFLEKSLVRPLRTYRHQLLPIHLRQRQKTEEMLGQEGAPRQGRTVGN